MAHLTIISITTVIFGIASLFLISRARNRLSEGSIRKYMDNFAICLVFIVIFSVWQTARTVFGINIDIEGLATYPEYIFIVFAYIAFIFASYRVLKIGEEFGFKEYGKKIEQIIKQKAVVSIPKPVTEITKPEIKKLKLPSKKYRKSKK